MSDRDEPTIVYTDGACSGNPGPGGWAWAVPNGPWASGAEALSTNQRMEVHAVLSAVTTLTGRVEVVSDSTYVVNCFRDRWWEGWLKRGWTNSSKKPVANRDLWEPLIDAYRADPQRLSFRWVKGHSNDPMNDLVDRLAVEAARTQMDASGGGPPDLATLPKPDVIDLSIDPRVPAGRRIVATGHKPPQLGGYDENLVAEGVRAALAEVLVAKRELHDDVVVMSGGGLGAEQLALEAAAAAGVPYVIVLPYPDPAAMWPATSRARFEKLVEGAEGVVLLQARPPESKQKAGAALARRDAWMFRNADEAIVVWDGQDALLGRTVRSLEDHVGEEDVWIITP